MSGHRQKGWHGKKCVKEGVGASVENGQPHRGFFPPRRQKIKHFSKRFLSKQKNNVRSFPQPNMRSLPCLANVWTCVQVGSLCLLGGLQASVTAIFTSAAPVLLNSVLSLPCSNVSPSIPAVPGVNIGRGLLPASWKDNCCCDVPLHFFFRPKISVYSVIP